MCGIVYNANATRLKHGRQTTCSRACSYELRASSKRDSEEQSCAVCGESFTRSPSQIKAKHGKTCCSRECAYKVRQRVCPKSYVLVSTHDRRAAMLKAWDTRRKFPKPYPDAARNKARAQLIQNLNKLGGVSKFERKAAQVLKSLGFNVATSAILRNVDGTFGAVFDIVLPERRLIIECHGTYWHGGRWTWDDPNASQAKNLSYERSKSVAARSFGFDLRILWEHEFRKDPCGALLAVVR